MSPLRAARRPATTADEQIGVNGALAAGLAKTVGPMPALLSWHSTTTRTTVTATNTALIHRPSPCR